MRFFVSVWLLLMMLFPAHLYAQQGRGIFFSIFGKDAPVEYGDFNNMQAFYFDIPLTETRPVYLRIFDADVGGRYDETHDAFNTKTRFLVVGGESANRIHGGVMENKYRYPVFNNRDLIADREYGVDPAADGKWISLTQLDLAKGFKTEDGFARFCLVVQGLEGDDGNFFDLALSYSKTDKRPPPNTRTFAYDLSIRAPSLALYDMKEFRAQVKLPIQGKKLVKIATFDMDDVPVTLSVPFQPDRPLETSGDGDWVVNDIHLPNAEYISWIGFNFFGRNFNNTFGMMLLDEQNKPMPIYLPIEDYEEPKLPSISYGPRYDAKDCFTIHFESSIRNSQNFRKMNVRWFVNGDTLRGNPVKVTFDSLGYHHYRVEIEGEYQGNRQIYGFTDSVLVNRPPIAWAGGERHHVAGKAMAFDGTVSEDLDGYIKEFEWDFGDGKKARGARVDHTYAKPGLYQVSLKVTDNSGTPCATTISTATVKINQPPIARINGPQIVQIDEQFMLDGSKSQDPDGRIIDYLWRLGRDTTLRGSTVQYALRDAKALPVTLYVMDDSETYNSIQSTSYTVRVNKPPIANAGANKIVSPERPATFNASRSYDPDGQIVSYEWNMGDGIIRDGAVIRHGYEKPGTYKVILKVTDDTGKGIGLDTMSVMVNAPPVAIISGDLLVTSGRVSLSGAESFDTDGEIISYEWDMGDGTRLTGKEVDHQYKKTGTFTVTLTISDDSGTYSSIQSERQRVTVNKVPVAVATAKTIVAPGEQVRFDGSKSKDEDGSIVEYTWDFGDGEKKTGAIVTHAFEKPGRYQVQLAVMDNTRLAASVDYDYIEVEVNHSPVAVVQAPPLIAPGQKVDIDLSQSYDPDGDALQFFWMIDGKWEKGTPRRSFTIRNEQNVIRYSIQDNKGVANSRTDGEVSVNVNQRPIARGNGPIRTAETTILFDGSGSYDPDNDELKYYWDFGDGRSARGAVASHRYRHGGPHIAVLTVDDQRGLDNSFAYDTVEVFINRPPEIYATLPSVVCVGEVFEYDATGTRDPDGEFLRYNWNFGDGKFSQSEKGTHRYAFEGNFQVILMVDDAEGMPNSTATFNHAIRVVGAPKANAGSDQIVCALELVQFDASESNASDALQHEYFWDFGDGTMGQGQRATHRYEKPGVYYATLRIESSSEGTCTSTSEAKVKITVVPEPTASFSLPQVVRINDPVVLDPSPSLQSGQRITEMKWEIEGRETITWTLDSRSNEWVSKSSSTTIPPQRSPNRVGFVESAGLPTLSRTFPEGDYQITLTVTVQSEGKCITANTSRTLRVRSKPQLAIKKIPTLVPGEAFTFSAAELLRDVNEIQRAFWDFGGGVRKDGLVTRHAFATPGTYDVTFVADDGNGGPSSITRMVETVVVNAAPQAVITGPERALAGTELSFSAEKSIDPDGELVQYQWFISDGKKVAGKTLRHTFERNGAYTITLTVTDNAGVANSTATVSMVVTVAEAPSVTLKLPTIICPETELDIVRGLSIPESDSSLVDIFIGTNRIPFKQARKQKISFPGNYTLRVVMKDGSGNDEGSTVARHTLRVNGAPEIYARVPETIKIGAANDFATFDASATFDPNGDVISFYWDMGDGTRKTGKVVRHLYTQPGTYTVTLVALDDKNLSCSQVEKKFTVKVVRG